jgi:competence protein ComEA
MSSFVEPLKNWFGHTRRERRSTFILLLIIVIIIAIRYTVPANDILMEDISYNIEDKSNFLPGDTVVEGELFPFDPNKASFDTLVFLGISEQEARTLISYRNKGGRLRKPSDIRKIYGIDRAKAEKLIPYIIVSDDSALLKSRNTFRKNNKLIDLNKCDSLSLLQLPGIGPVFAARIIKYRKLLGGYASVEQLKEVYGLPRETYNNIAGRFFADSTIIRRVKINSAEYNEIIRLPYFEKYEVTAILKYRKLIGRLNGIEEMVDKMLISPEKGARLSPYLDFGE